MLVKSVRLQLLPPPSKRGNLQNTALRKGSLQTVQKDEPCPSWTREEKSDTEKNYPCDILRLKYSWEHSSVWNRHLWLDCKTKVCAMCMKPHFYVYESSDFNWSLALNAKNKVGFVYIAKKGGSRNSAMIYKQDKTHRNCISTVCPHDILHLPWYKKEKKNKLKNKISPNWKIY